MPLRPLNDVVIIEPDENLKYEGILEMPDNNNFDKRSYFATIVSCGPECKYKFKPGQRILLERWAEEGRDSYVLVDGKRLRFIFERYIHAVME